MYRIDIEDMNAIVISSSYAEAVESFSHFKYDFSLEPVEKPIFSTNVTELNVQMCGSSIGARKVVILYNTNFFTQFGLCQRILNFIMHLMKTDSSTHVVLIGELPASLQQHFTTISNLEIIVGDPLMREYLEMGRIETANSIIIFRPEGNGIEYDNLARLHGFVLQMYEAVRHYLSVHVASTYNTTDPSHDIETEANRHAETEPFIICEAANESTLIGLEYLSTATATNNAHKKKMYRTGYASSHKTEFTHFTFFAAGHCTSGTFNDTCFAQSILGGSKGTTYDVMCELAGFNAPEGVKPSSIHLVVIPNTVFESCSTFLDIQLYFLNYYQCLTLALYRYDDYNGTHYIYTAPNRRTVLRESDKVLVLV